MLETFMNLHMSQFSSLFEIGATLNIAFVVAEQAKQYGSMLAKNFFKTSNNVKWKFDNLLATVDIGSIETMNAIIINNISTEGQIQETKREYHKLEDSMKDRTESIKKQTEDCSVLNNFAYISLYMFLYSLAALFVGGLNETPFIKNYWATFTILSAIVIIFISFFGEKTKNINLENCCYLIIVLMFLSSFSILYRFDVEPYCTYYWPYSIILSAMLPYLSFIIFMVVIRKRLKVISQSIEQCLTEFDNECQNVKGHIDRLKQAYDLSVTMNAENGEATNN